MDSENVSPWIESERVFTPQTADDHAADIEASLNWAAAHYILARRSSDASPGTGRRAVIFALGATIDHLRELGVHPSSYQPLRALHDALEDLDRGNIHPLLAKTAGNKPPPPGEHLLVRAHVAVAVDLLYRVTGDLNEACNRVARKLDAIGVNLHGNRRMARTAGVVKRWRHQIRALPKSDRVYRIYNGLLPKIEAEGFDFDEAASIILQRLRDNFNTEI